MADNTRLFLLFLIINIPMVICMFVITVYQIKMEQKQAYVEHILCDVIDKLYKEVKELKEAKSNNENNK